VKLPAVSGGEVVKALRKSGFDFVRQKGSHIRLEKTINEEVIRVTVPLHEILKKGTLRRILKDAGMNVGRFVELL